MFVIEYKKKNSNESWRFHSRYKDIKELEGSLLVMNNPNHNLDFEYREKTKFTN